MNLRTKRRLRWLVPTAVVAVTAGITGASSVLPAGADPVPVLPTLTPAQLLDKVRNVQVTTLTGDISMSSHLGLPDLGSLGVRTGSLIDVLTGSHTAHVSIDGPEHVRVALDAPQAETDWIRNGNDLWSWDSSSQHVLHTTMPVQAAEAADTGSTDPADSADSADPADPADTKSSDGDTTPRLDPAAAANELLAAIDPTTLVTVRTPGYVAGRPVYELVVAPRSDKSTIGDGVISVDAATGLPLAVRVDAKATGKPAIEVRFTSVSFDKPASSTFEFAPPPGSTVEQASDPTQLLPFGRSDGEGRHRRDKAARAAAANGADGGTGADAGTDPAATAARSKMTTVGTGWESVAIVSSASIGGQFQGLLDNAPVVQVGSRSAHLVSTSLINALLLDDGRIAIAAMTPDALAAAVATQ